MGQAMAFSYLSKDLQPKMAREEMMRWWDNDVFVKRRSEAEDEVLRMREELIHEEDQKIAYENKGLRQFTFRVEAKTERLERVGVSGNCAELGSWVPENIVLLDREGDTDVWSKNVVLPLLTDQFIKYRYLIVTDENYDAENVKKGKTVPMVKSIRRWEANRTVRKVAPISEVLQPTASFRKEYLKMSVQAIREARREKMGPPPPDTFGQVNNSNVVSMGWLTNEDVLEVILFRRDLRFFEKAYSKKPIFIKLRTIRVENGSQGMEDFCEDPYDGWPVVEASGLSDSSQKFRRLGDYGFRWCRQENVIFLIFHDNSNSLGILMDFYVYSNTDRLIENDLSKPYHTGAACLHPCSIPGPEGIVTTDIFDIKGRTIGEIKLKYVFIRCLKQIKYRLNHSLASLWASMWTPSRDEANVIKTCSETRENTVASVDSTIAAEGFKYVEITIQYTKDNLPIFSHSPYVVVAIKNPTDMNPLEQYQVAVNKFTLSQLHKLRILPVNECNNILKLKGKVYPNDEKNRPFPTLMQLLNSIDKKVGFVIEVSTMLPRENGTYNEYHDYDVNENLEKLLKALQQSAGRRDIILTSFHPDVCTMMRLKQNAYPVVFLPEGIPDKYPRYDQDVRCKDLDSAIHFAVSMELHGLGLNEDTILKPGNALKIQKYGLVVYCLDFDSKREKTLRDYMTKYKLNGILCKRSDESGRFRRTFGYYTTTKGNERKTFSEWSDEADKDGYIKPDIYPLEHTMNTITVLENMILLPPSQVPAALSRYHVTPMSVIKENEEENENVMPE